MKFYRLLIPVLSAFCMAAPQLTQAATTIDWCGQAPAGPAGPIVISACDSNNTTSSNLTMMENRLVTSINNCNNSSKPSKQVASSNAIALATGKNACTNAYNCVTAKPAGQYQSACAQGMANCQLYYSGLFNTSWSVPTAQAVTSKENQFKAGCK